MCDPRHGARSAHYGFTLIELLVAIALLSVIVVAVTNLFTHSTTAWDSGTRRSESMMVGRALTDYFVSEAAMALGDPYAPDASEFTVLKGTVPMTDKEFGLADLFGDTTTLSASGPAADVSDPRLVAFQVRVITRDKGRTESRLHTGRAFLWNRNRYRYDAQE